MMPQPPRTPRWMTALIVVLLLPVFQLPVLLANAEPDSPARTMIWIYPIYALLSGYLAWQCYPQRHATAWILLVLLLMSHVAIWMLVFSPLNSF